jgi:hypothetical protein
LGALIVARVNIIIGTYEGWGLVVTYERWGWIVGLLGGATVGALAGTIGRAYRARILLPSSLFGLCVIFVLLGDWVPRVLHGNWSPVRSWGWIWVGISLALLGPEMIASILMRLWPSGRMAERVARRLGLIIQYAETIMFVAGAVVSSAVLVGQIGDLLAGHVGLEIGELVGGLLGLPLAVITNNRFLANDSHRLPWNVFSVRHWIGMVVFLVLADGGVLWLLLSDRSQ